MKFREFVKSIGVDMVSEKKYLDFIDSLLIVFYRLPEPEVYFDEVIFGNKSIVAVYYWGTERIVFSRYNLRRQDSYTNLWDSLHEFLHFLDAHIGIKNCDSRCELTTDDRVGLIFRRLGIPITARAPRLVKIEDERLKRFA
jgi:Zn-dependent peptidase ImmA (M78 family)